MENNKVLHELLGKCWHEFDVETGRCKCGLIYYPSWSGNPDYAADPRLVLEGMKEAGQEEDFILEIGYDDTSVLYVPVDLIRDKSGRLMGLAIEFLRILEKQDEGGKE